MSIFSLLLQSLKLASHVKNISAFTEKKKKQARFSWAYGNCQRSSCVGRTQGKRPQETYCFLSQIAQALIYSKVCLSGFWSLFLCLISSWSILDAFSLNKLWPSSGASNIACGSTLFSALLVFLNGMIASRVPKMAKTDKRPSVFNCESALNSGSANR